MSKLEFKIASCYKNSLILPGLIVGEKCASETSSRLVFNFGKLFWKKVILKEDYQRSSKNVTIFVFEPSLTLWKTLYEK